MGTGVYTACESFYSFGRTAISTTVMAAVDRRDRAVLDCNTLRRKQYHNIYRDQYAGKYGIECGVQSRNQYSYRDQYRDQYIDNSGIECGVQSRNQYSNKSAYSAQSTRSARSAQSTQSTQSKQLTQSRRTSMYRKAICEQRGSLPIPRRFSNWAVHTRLLRCLRIAGEDAGRLN